MVVLLLFACVACAVALRACSSSSSSIAFYSGTQRSPSLGMRFPPCVNMYARDVRHEYSHAPKQQQQQTYHIYGRSVGSSASSTAGSSIQGQAPTAHTDTETRSAHAQTQTQAHARVCAYKKSRFNIPYVRECVFACAITATHTRLHMHICDVLCTEANGEHLSVESESSRCRCRRNALG